LNSSPSISKEKKNSATKKKNKKCKYKIESEDGQSADLEKDLNESENRFSLNESEQLSLLILFSGVCSFCCFDFDENNSNEESSQISLQTSLSSVSFNPSLVHNRTVKLDKEKEKESLKRIDELHLNSLSFEQRTESWMELSATIFSSLSSLISLFAEMNSSNLETPSFIGKRGNECLLLLVNLLPKISWNSLKQTEFIDVLFSFFLLCFYNKILIVILIFS
jgi:hypothetical protein